MSIELDNAYRSTRTRLLATVAAATAATWTRRHRDRDRAIEETVGLVEAGQRVTVSLVDAYLAAKLVDAGQDGKVKGLNPVGYTIGVLRGVDPVEVYGRPFGALAAHLETGAEFADALQSGLGSLERLARTDLQLTQTHAARDWMQDEERIVGYRRVLGGGHSCSLCRSASTRTYRREDLMPIHERCSCSVAPVFGTVPVASVGTTVKVVDDPELGPRLIADEWSETGPRLFEAA